MRKENLKAYIIMHQHTLRETDHGKLLRCLLFQISSRQNFKLERFLVKWEFQNSCLKTPMTDQTTHSEKIENLHSTHLSFCST